MINFKKLKKEFNIDEFYNFLKQNPKQNILTEIEARYKLDIIREPRVLLDDKYPNISLEDGSFFEFLNKEIKFDLLFYTKRSKYMFDDFDATSAPHIFYFLVSFKNYKNQFVLVMTDDFSIGWDLSVIKVFNTKINFDKIKKIILNKHFVQNAHGYQFIFFSKILKIKAKSFVNKFVKKLMPLNESSGLDRGTIATLTMQIYEVDLKNKIPFISNVEYSSFVNYFYKSKKIKPNLRLKVFKKNKSMKINGQKLDLVSTKNFKAKPLFVYNFNEKTKFDLKTRAIYF